MYILSRNSYADARQGPAVIVIPVLIPIKPCLRSNLFVLFHSTLRLAMLPELLVVHLKFCVETIFLK
mgnify:FL=1